jgi:PAS domain S-box-containing protein
MSPCEPASETLAGYLEARSQDITQRWRERALQALALAAPSRGALLDILPELLVALGGALREGLAPSGSEIGALAEAHGRQSFHRGFDISSVVREYSVLRDVILDVLREGAYPVELDALKLLLDALALAAAEALKRYSLEHEQALRASEAKLQDIIDHAPAVVFAKDPQGRYLFVNRAFEAQVGAPRQSLVGRTDYDCFSKEAADTFRATDAQVLSTGQPLEVEEVVPQVDGPHLWRSLKFSLPGRDQRPSATCCIATDITHSRRMERERDEARERLRRVLESLPVVYWSFDSRGMITVSEGQALEKIGFKPGQFVGQSVFELVASDPLVREAAEQSLSGVACCVETAFRDFWFQAEFIPRRGPDGAVEDVFGLALDITERKHAEENLRQSETRYRLAVQATSDAVWDWDVVTNQVHWSEKVDRIIGSEPAEVDRALEWWSERIHPEDRGRVMSGLRAFIDSGEEHWTDEYRFRRVDGSYMFVSDRGSAVRDERGRAVRMVGALEDITARKVAEREAHRRAGFEQHLIGIVSHDLRNPLNAITMAASLLLKQGKLEAQQQRSLRRIVSSAERATRMLRDLLDFTQARLEGALPVTPRALDLHELTRQVVEEVQLAHPQRRLLLERGGDGQGAWDEDRLAQLITNLVNNALTYSEESSPVRVRTQGQPDAVELSVHNTGKPIPPELMPQLFQPLKRGDGKGSRGTHSIGLGLFIVKHIVEAHGGRISVDSSEEHGTTFTVSLPRSPPGAAAPPGS